MSKRLSYRTFGRIVRRIMETLPEEFQPYLDNLVVDIEPRPTRRVLRHLGLTDEEIAAGESLYGLFDPLQLPTNWSADAIDTSAMLHRLVIYKQPLEEDFPDRRELLLEIRKTVIHELAHHFGYSESDLDRFEAEPDPFRDGLLEELLQELSQSEQER
jgi:predicted Zn-dependent protease with MMP-like domain